jgi:hypothetical protein
MNEISLINNTDRKPRRKILVDEFSYTVSTSSGEEIIILPGSRTYSSDEHLIVRANGLKIHSGVEYNRYSETAIQARDCAMFPDQKFPNGCVLSFEQFSN